jgi:UDP-N-acetylglucosamine 2-epimerase (non-hydrolysing)
MLTVLTIFGTRPEAIKLAPVIRELEKHPAEVRPVVCVTAQHREMLDQILDLFSITPDTDLDIMRHDQSLFDVTTSSLGAIEGVLRRVQPDLVLVQGDTTTTFAAALAAFYLKIPVGHVEAGLRTEDKYHPFPEEINRRLVTHVADLHFAATETARSNLLAEGIPQDVVFVTGNPVIDSLLLVADDPSFSEQRLVAEERLNRELEFLSSPEEKRLILVTAHRRESHGEGLENIFGALKRIAGDNSDVEIVYPVHLNPNVKGPAARMLGGIRNVHLLEPVDYAPFVLLMRRSYMIVTDSGGIQEEAPSLGKPVLVTRKVTERPEAIEAGTTRLVGVDADTIAAETQRLLDDHDEYARMAKAVNPYGDGRAATRIVEIILDGARSK